jgi:hypothetical protein
MLHCAATSSIVAVSVAIAIVSVCMVNVPKEAVVVIDDEAIIYVVNVPNKAVVEVTDQEIVRDHIVGEEVTREDTARNKEGVRCTRAAQSVGQSLIGEQEGAGVNVTYQDFIIKVKAIVEAIEPIIDTVVYTVDLIIDTVVYTVAPVVAVVVLAIVVAVTVVVFGHGGSGQSHQHSRHHGDYPKN